MLTALLTFVKESTGCEMVNDVQQKTTRNIEIGSLLIGSGGSTGQAARDHEGRSRQGTGCESDSSWDMCLY